MTISLAIYILSYMPQIPTYIRQADWDKYIAIQSSGGWPEFIHNALNPSGTVLVNDSEGTHPVQTVTYKNDKPIKTPKHKNYLKDKK